MRLMPNTNLRAKWRTWTVVSLVLAVAAALLVAVGPERASGADGAGGRRWITDGQGRALVLNGLNTASSAKSAPDGMPWIHSADVAREKRRLGTNFVRFLIQWRTIEPRPGRYDDRYLDEVAARVGWYGSRGYHVMLDMHQDVYGPRTKGNGAPAWATETDGLPVAEQGQWELEYVQPGTLRAFDHFWGTRRAGRNLRARYAAAWAHVAARFAHDPAVIGYDLMNEPWGGSLQGPAFEAGPLAALYRRTIAAIRSVDPDSWIFVEPEAVSANWGLPSGLPYLKDPRGDGDRARIAYAPHLYPLPMDLGGGYTGGTRAWVRRTLGSWRAQTERTARRLDAPVVIGEYGLDATRPGALTYVAEVRRTAERLGAGTAYWSNDPGPWAPWRRSKGGRLRATKLLAVLDRPTPLAVAGIPESYGWDGKSHTLAVRWEGAAGVTGGTEVYLPERFFPDGGRVTGGDVVSWDAASRVLVLRSGPGDHHVRITPATGARG
ncbi:cellulase family glycosylhydrolase [Streptomyces beihaiensis]|uniref:Cellulase family glycosylhydrolase n=1 Tax=Streptomyces beihaiensis TaxID=2984495 RepID=A0ABT3TRN1_9ACTN|nr:cellulase family glycosylhydrolase [Streptomyces beihaiensis]MCX3059703.1 cellulase family glycosylhydrolase [Streptomyces beihaiensis]